MEIPVISHCESDGAPCLLRGVPAASRPQERAQPFYPELAMTSSPQNVPYLSEREDDLVLAHSTVDAAREKDGGC